MQIRKGLLDNASPLAIRLLCGGVLAVSFGVFIAMLVVAPMDPVTGIGADAALKTLNTGDTAWMLVSTALVLLMTPGVAFFYGGMAQHKNVVSTIMQAFVPLAIIPILWSIIGFGLAFGPSPPGSAGIIGDPAGLGGLMFGVGAAPNADLAATIPLSVYWAFQLVFAVLTPSLLIGSIADRVNPSALCLFISLWHLVVYCPLAHMVWHPTGLIRVWGVLDFAGGTVVHMSSGYAALVAAVYLGRTLKIPVEDDSGLFSSIKEPANVPIVMLGTALLWFGWFGFNAGSAGAANALAGQAFINTNAAAATAMLAFMLMDVIRGHKMRATGACVGAVIGLVAVTPAAGYVTLGAASLIGIIGAMVCSGIMELMEHYGSRYVDDSLDVFACHGVGGTVGMVCTALFCTTGANTGGAMGAFYNNPLELAKTLAVLFAIVPWICIFTWGCLWVTDRFLSLRASDLEILEGLDVSKHGERAVAVGHLVKELDASIHAGGRYAASANGSAHGKPTVGAAAV